MCLWNRDDCGFVLLQEELQLIRLDRIYVLPLFFFFKFAHFNFIWRHLVCLSIIPKSKNSKLTHTQNPPNKNKTIFPPKEKKIKRKRKRKRKNTHVLFIVKIHSLSKKNQNQSKTTQNRNKTQEKKMKKINPKFPFLLSLSYNPTLFWGVIFIFFFFFFFMPEPFFGYRCFCFSSG